MLKTMTCRVCGREFQARHTPAYYCSNACKQKAKRRRQRRPYEPVEPPRRPAPDQPAPPADCVSAVQDAQRVANDLGRLSATAPYQLRPRFARLAEAFTAALEAEGL